MPRRLSALFAAVFAVVLAMSTGALPARAGDDRTLTIGMTQFPSTFNPLIDSMVAKSYVLGMTRRPLTTYDKDWKLVCLLCVTLPTIENGLAKPVDLPPLKPGAAGKDGKPRKGIALTYQIRPKARWGDGVPVTVKDIIFTWQVGRHPQSGVASAEGFRRIVKIEPKDDKTFVMTVDRITFDYNDQSNFDVLPAHLEEKPFRASPADYKNQTTFDTDPTNKGLYFGPYRIAKVETGSYVTLVPNPTWYGKTPYFKHIVVRVFQNTAALEANLRAGDIDYVAGELGLSLDQALALQKRRLRGYNFNYKAGLSYEHIDLNLDNPILKDLRVRQALILSIDRAAISKHLFAGKQPVADSFLSPLDAMSDPDVPKYRFNPKKAAKLLDAAGWKRKGRYRENAKGERLTLEFGTTAGNRSREVVEQALQSYWRNAGIEVVIRNEPASVFFGQTMTQRRFKAMAMYAWISSPEAVPRSTLHSRMIPSRKNNWAGQNYTGFRAKRMDNLIDAVEVELDPVKRKAIWRDIQWLYGNALPVIPLYFRADPYIIPKWLKGVEPTGHQFPSTLWIENWRRAK
jgi:peptide/nickel transport system substrate-binding protein